MTTQAKIDAIRAEPIAPQSLFIDGKHVAGSAAPMGVTSPIDGSALTTIANATSGEVDLAVTVYITAFEHVNLDGSR